MGKNSETCGCQNSDNSQHMANLNNQLIPDLTSQDWVNTTIETMVHSVDPNIKVVFTKQKEVLLSNIGEESLLNLKFLTNNDLNNNYVTLINFVLFTDDDNFQQPLVIPGLKDVAVYCWKYNDSNSFLNGNNTFLPFGTLVLKDPCSNSLININEYIDIYTSMLSSIYLSTLGKVKKYSLRIGSSK
jgi:hypothetical protein